MSNDDGDQTNGNIREAMGFNSALTSAQLTAQMLATTTMNLWTVPPTGSSTEMVCQNCGARPGTVIWSEGTMAWIHGSYQMLCELCSVKAQLVFARERAAAIPDLERKLAELEQAK